MGELALLTARRIGVIRLKCSEFDTLATRLLALIART